MTAQNIPNFVSHLECSWTGERAEAGVPQQLSPAGKPYLVRYDLEGAAAALTKETVAARGGGMWAWRELLPVSRAENVVSLGEAATPLIDLPRFGSAHGARAPVVKDEGRLPTGSFKARGLGMAVSMAKELGIGRIAMPTNGNAGAALAAYGSAAGMETYVFCPADTPEVNVREIALQGAKVWRVNGLINDCGKIVGEGRKRMGWFDMSTLKEPYRIEGKKTMGLELLWQLGWQVPDAIFYPTGGGTGLIGMWKAFDELERIGWIGSERPRMIAVQASGCAPIVRAYERGERTAEPWQDAHTEAAGIRVPAAVGDFLILDAVRDSGGFAMAVDDAEIMAVRDRIAKEDGLLLCPEGAATAAAWARALDEGKVGKQDRAVLFNCATGLKYPMPPAPQALDKAAVDWEAIAEA
ncbi:threonine synthase [Pacificimonas flava]|uniref:Threonine synthase n=2 Tax=Pacificimonas TaxID=1960290 RepID=A0A219B0E8_9SPHN|nr:MULTISPECIES: threonine synthase [Pacificimonas]MBZ6379744.1 threonine synthase [Pacificimonas aurantium]OWV31801.1 threonine synthase [Pacificimonas flava]